MAVKFLLKSICLRFVWVYILLFAGLSALINERMMDVKVVNNLGNHIIALNQGITSGQGLSRERLFGTLRFLDSFARLNPKSPFLLTTIAHCYVLLDEPQPAIEYYQRALELNTSLVGVYHNLGILYIQQEKWEQAVFWLTKGQAVEPQMETHLLTKMLSPYASPKKQIVKQYGIIYANIRQLIHQAETRDSAGINKDRIIYYAMTRF